MSRHLERAIENIDLALAEPDPLAGLTAAEVAVVALRGLRASVDQGYMQDQNARAMYARHFPGFEYDRDDLDHQMAIEGIDNAAEQLRFDQNGF